MSSPWNPTGLGGEETVMLESQGPGGVMEQSAGAAVARSSIGDMLYIRLCDTLCPILFLFPQAGSHGPWVEGALCSLSLEN